MYYGPGLIEFVIIELQVQVVIRLPKSIYNFRNISGFWNLLEIVLYFVQKVVLQINLHKIRNINTVNILSIFMTQFYQYIFIVVVLVYVYNIIILCEK